MAGTQREPPLDLMDELRRGPGRFSFYQALRILSKASLGRDSGTQAGRLAGLRLCTRMGSDFPTGDFGAWETSGPGGPDRLELTCMGLTGPGSPLPKAWIETLLEDPATEGIQPLLDGFTHRLGLLCLDAWRSARPWAQAEVRAPGGVMAHLADLTGPTWHLSEPSLAGLLLRHPIPGEAFLSLAQVTLGVPVRIEPFLATWHPIPAQHRARLGAPTTALTGSTPLGPRWMNRQGSVGLHLGPMGLPALRDLLPGGSRHPRLIDLSLALSPSRHCDQWVHLDTCGLPRLRLGTQEPRQGLGQCTRITSPHESHSPATVQLRWPSPRREPRPPVGFPEHPSCGSF